MTNLAIPLHNIRFAIAFDAERRVNDCLFECIYKVYCEQDPDDVTYQSISAAQAKRDSILRLLPWSNGNVDLGPFVWDAKLHMYVAEACIQIIRPRM